jgi:hypothetical protein
MYFRRAKASFDRGSVIAQRDRHSVARWPAARITLRQGIRVVHDTG